ncbi:MAG TPA: extracellular solute-binding protein, partial [Chloroflexota bacterium]|nr:extracellular solute-binding protein [Chloroflexota bacterium]
SAATTAAATTSAATSAAPTSQAAASAPPSKGGALTLMTQTDAKQATMYQKITAPFPAANGGAKVNIIQGGAGSTDIQQKLLLLISANTPPDVYWTHTYINSGLASLGIPVDIAPYMARDKAFDTSDMFAPSLADFNVGGKQYAFPRETTAIVMAYNKTLFQKAGIAEPVATWNWQDYLTACQKLTSGSGPTQNWGTAGWTSTAVIYPAIVRVWEKGSDIVDEQRATYTLDQAGGVAGIQDIADLIHKYQVHASAAALQGTNVNDLFNTGRIAMVPTINVYGGFANAKFEWDIQAMPHDAAMTTRVASAGHSMASEGTNQDLAWNMLKTLASKEAFQDYYTVDALPVASKSVRAAAVTANGTKSPAHIQLGVDALGYARPERVVGNWSSVHATIAGALGAVWGPEKKSVQQVLTSVGPQVTALIKAKPTAAK